jgi:2-polyprenyl-6-methoxyphenol hydroxylase-like FAD-dependent oxidoreductase
MKIIIVGAGISGLATYLFLHKYCGPLTELEIIIYESHNPSDKLNIGDATFQELSSSSLIVGGGLGLSPNGMRLIRELGPELHERVKNEGFVAENFVFRSARGWRISCTPTSDNRGKPGFPAGEEEHCISISRQGLRDTLDKEVGADKVVYKKVVQARKATGGKRAAVIFADGSEDDADLIIGADGVRSEVLRGIFGQDDEKVKPQYDGLIGVGGFIEGPIPEEIKNDKSMVFTFGPNGFFGYGANSLNSTMWWSTCQAENVPEQRKISVEDMQAQLKARHGKWKDPIVQNIIKNAAVEQIYPVWTSSELPHWGQDGLVVIGDAAHALNPTSGQGSSQGLEDAKCLSLLLSKFFTKHTEEPLKVTSDQAIAFAIKSFYEVRSPRIQKIVKRTKMMSQSKKDQNIVEEMMVCAILWLMTTFPAVGMFD